MVVVLIIGILAAIALPQYKQVVLKSRLATVKTNAHTLALAIQRYYLTNSKAPESINDLDIKIPKSNCYFNYSDGNFREIACTASSGSNKITYIAQAYYKSSKINRYCYTWDVNNLSSTSNKVCQEETNRTTPTACDGYCTYPYQ